MKKNKIWAVTFFLFFLVSTNVFSQESTIQSLQKEVSQLGIELFELQEAKFELEKQIKKLIEAQKSNEKEILKLKSQINNISTSGTGITISSLPPLLKSKLVEFYTVGNELNEGIKKRVNLPNFNRLSIKLQGINQSINKLWPQGEKYQEIEQLISLFNTGLTITPEAWNVYNEWQRSNYGGKTSYSFGAASDNYTEANKIDYITNLAALLEISESGLSVNFTGTGKDGKREMKVATKYLDQMAELRTDDYTLWICGFYTDGSKYNIIGTLLSLCREYYERAEKKILPLIN
jgi:hypothetical protein